MGLKPFQIDSPSPIPKVKQTNEWVCCRCHAEIFGPYVEFVTETVYSIYHPEQERIRVKTTE